MKLIEITTIKKMSFIVLNTSKFRNKKGLNQINYNSIVQNIKIDLLFKKSNK